MATLWFTIKFVVVLLVLERGAHYVGKWWHEGKL